MTSITVASSPAPALPQPSTASPSAVASSSRLPETPLKEEFADVSLTPSSSSIKKRKFAHANEDEDEDESDDEDLDHSSSSVSPSKPTSTGRRGKASDEERKARLEARQARNRLSAQYSRERKKAYVEQLEGSVNSLKSENTLLRQQRDQDQLIRQALEAKFNDAQTRINTLETILRTVAPSLVPLLMSSSSSSSSSSSASSSLPSSSSSFAAPSYSALAPQIDAGLSADLASALLQNNGLASKEVTLPLTIAAPASTASSSLSLGTLDQQTSNEDFVGVADTRVANGRVGSNVDANGSSIVNQEYPLAGETSLLAAEQPSTIAAGSQTTLPQHSVEAAKAASVARETEALLSNFINLDDAKFANGDATTATQDQGASTPTAQTQPISVGEDSAASATAGASRSASASAGELASLSAANTKAGSAEGESGEHSSKFNTISLPQDDNKNADMEQRFQLLNSPLLPTERNMWELATDAMLQDIYGNSSEQTADTSGLSVVESSDATSAGSSPFDLVDLDIEIEEPLQLNIGLDENESSGLLGSGHNLKADTAMDWPGLLASLVA
ncbi:uncharacterized protein MEPE_04714 [Melanopsichium pennsylvanicum]|uniref:BZIP domain-containing protein n=2 Tax=Melanopsichium pennsylvanicum TaxID=63383 RepID=A0AAJ4XPA5_9BASI|nr:putative protein [Melanopsichium pennsylvanicum 4]SNX86005.1 uncharacterized protein MEPE_04714 [Melanopsichium pennsylvanicum]